MKEIICPTDFSENSINAIEYGIQIAKRNKSKLILLHCYHSFFVPSTTFPVASLDLESDAKAEMEKLVKQLIDHHGLGEVAYEIDIRPGLVVDQVTKLADKLHADLVVMGTHGASGLEEALLGSNTSTLISRTQVPVLVIPREVRYSGIATITFATDFQDDNETVVRQLIQLAKAFDAQIYAVHILEPEEEYTTEQREQLGRLYPELFDYSKLEFHLINARDIISGLNTFIEKSNSDLLAMLTHRRNFFERIFHRSITKRMACHTHIPLLAFHE